MVSVKIERAVSGCGTQASITVVVHWHPDHLPARRRLPLLRRTEAQIVEDAPDGQLVGDVGDDLERTPQRLQTRGSAWYTLRMSAQLGAQRRWVEGSAGTSEASMCRREDLRRLE